MRGEKLLRRRFRSNRIAVDSCCRGERQIPPADFLPGERSPGLLDPWRLRLVVTLTESIDSTCGPGFPVALNTVLGAPGGRSELELRYIAEIERPDIVIKDIGAERIATRDLTVQIGDVLVGKAQGPVRFQSL